MRNRPFVSAFIPLAILFVSSVVLRGQTVDSALTGSVVDPSDAAVPNAEITATRQGMDVVFSTRTGSAGEYLLSHLPVGAYEVSVNAPEFAGQRVEGVELPLSRTITVNFRLSLASKSSSVEVRHALPPLDMTGAQVQVTFETRAVGELPWTASGSGIYNLSLLGANVASPGGIGIGVGPAVAGQRPTANRYVVEGADNNNYLSPAPLGTISNEAGAEVSLLQNPFGIEQGGVVGGVFNAVVKSGGNALHGSLYEYMQNRNLNAMDAQAARQGLKSIPRFDANRMGVTVGGPLRRNKLFFFGSYEYNPVGYALTISNPMYAPTRSGYAVLDSIGGVSKNNLQVLEKYLQPAVAATGSVSVLGSAIPIGPLQVVGPSYSNSHRAALSADWVGSEADRVRARYIYGGQEGVDPNSSSTLPQFYANAPSNAQFLSLSEFHSFSPTMQNEFRIAYSRLNARRTLPEGLQFPGLNSFPTLTFVDLGGLQVGPNASVPSGQMQGVLQFADSVSKVWGRHMLHAGYDFRDVILTVASVTNPRGLYNYKTLERYLQDLTPDGTTSSRGLGTAGPLTGGIPTGFLQNSAFFTDSFRMMQGLTLEAGLRYEYVTVPVAARAQKYSAIADVPGVLTFRAPASSAMDWSPRIGFAYSPKRSEAWVIRGGFGRAFDLPYTNLTVTSLPSFYGGTSVVNPNSATPNFLSSGGAAPLTLATDTASARAGITGYNPDQNRPYAIYYTLGVQRLLGRDYTVEARYAGTRGVHLYVQDQLSRYSVVNSQQYLPTFFSTPSPAELAGLKLTLGDLNTLAAANRNPWGSYGFTNTITSFEPRGNSEYHGLALQVTKRYSRNISVLGSYTWSHALDDSTATLNTTILTPRRPQDFQGMRGEWASSMLDRRHRWTVAPIVDFRPFSQRGWLLKNVAGNWSGSLIYTYESPEFATVQSNIDANLNGDNTPDRAIVNPKGTWNVGSDATPIDRNGNVIASTSSLVAAYVATNPNARYVVARSGALANAGRNTLPLDPIHNVDASLRKVIPLGEGKRLELGAQFYNLLNHPQYTAGWINDVYITRSSNRNFLIPNNPSFGQYQQFFPSNARWAQVIGKITF